jgi:hypothetical protein
MSFEGRERLCDLQVDFGRRPIVSEKEVRFRASTSLFRRLETDETRDQS